VSECVMIECVLLRCGYLPPPQPPPPPSPLLLLLLPLRPCSPARPAAHAPCLPVWAAAVCRSAVCRLTSDSCYVSANCHLTSATYLPFSCTPKALQARLDADKAEAVRRLQAQHADDLAEQARIQNQLRAESSSTAQDKDTAISRAMEETRRVGGRAEGRAGSG
jgi:hypothetical protein